GSVRFHGLTPTNMQLDGLEKHLRLIESYKKLHAQPAGSGSPRISLSGRSAFGTQRGDAVAAAG
ncbi:MAG: hypothetical protein ACQER3_21390, partial [Pseudomonadota bacterium]